MEMKKKKNLRVNCAVCDMRKVTEETLDQYDSITVNAGTVLSCAAARQLLAGHDVTVHTGSTVDLPDGDVAVSTQNGAMTLSAGQKPAVPTFLIVNGRLTVEEGAADTLAGYVRITVNGKVLYPRSLSGALSQMNVNGKAECYPDGAVLLKSTFVMDDTFALRARDVLYYASGRIVLLKDGIDLAMLAEKGARFSTKTALIARRYAEKAAPLFDDQTELVILPDGCAFVEDDATLSDALIRRRGGMLYVNGDLTLDKNSGDALNQLTFLRVNGDVTLPRALEDAFLSLDAEYDALHIASGRRFAERISITVTKRMLGDPEGVCCSECAKVRIAPDVTEDQILDRLRLSECAYIFCTPEQRSAVEQVAEECAVISDGSEEDGGTPGLGIARDIMDSLGGSFVDPGTQTVNANEYTL